MKKRNVLNLIKYYTEQNDEGFRREALNIAKYFDENNDPELAEYIQSLLALSPSFTSQEVKDSHRYEDVEDKGMPFHEPMRSNLPQREPLFLPDEIIFDIQGIVKAIDQKRGVHTFLFYGDPGTGKTEAVKQIADILNFHLKIVDFDLLLDSKMGQSSKNISEFFAEINTNEYVNTIILFDEIDALALDRIRQSDVREMGRVTSTVMRGLDRLSPDRYFFATTNLYLFLDKALIRRFDATVNFDRYTQDDLADVAVELLKIYAVEFPFIEIDTQLLTKVLSLAEPYPSPAILKNLLRTSIAFSDEKDPKDYLHRLFQKRNEGKPEMSIEELASKGFTLREIETLTHISKSQVARRLKEAEHA